MATSIHAIADRLAPTVRTQFLDAVAKLQAKIPLDDLAAAVESGVANVRIHAAVKNLPADLQGAVSTVNRVFEETAKQVEKGFARRFKLGTGFDLVNPRALDASLVGGRLITQVTEETRAAINGVINRAIREGLPPRRAAQIIRPTIGLTQRQAQAVMNYEASLLGAGMSAAAAQQAAAKYAARQLRERALTIARTETINAGAAGRNAVWKEAQARGFLPPNQGKKWVVTYDDRLCPACQAMSGKTVLLGELYLTPDGRQISGPTLHPRCRCTEVLVIVKASQARTKVVNAPPAPVPPPLSAAQKAAQTRAARKAQGLPPLKPKKPKTLSPSVVTPETAASTEAAYLRPDGTWTPDRLALHDQIVEDMLRGVPASTRPTVYMTGGGPASGKSTMMKSHHATLPGKGRYAHVDPDEIKARLPEYKALLDAKDPRAASFVHNESSHLAERLSREATRRRLDVLVDGVGNGSIDQLTAKVRMLRAEGHRVVAYYATNDVETAVRLAMERGRQTGRFVPESYIRATHAGVSRVLPEAVTRGLFDEVTLFDTSDLAYPRIIMTARGSVMDIRRRGEWQLFLGKEAPVVRDAAVAVTYTPDEMRRAVSTYVGSDYRYINDALRRGADLSTLEDYQRKAVHVLDAMIDGHRLESATTGWRGVSSRAGLENLKVGDTFSDNGFISVARQRDVAFSRPVMLQIEMPAGTRMIDIATIDNSMEEAEILLKRGTRFEVVSVEQQQYSKKIIKVRVTKQ